MHRLIYASALLFAASANASGTLDAIDGAETTLTMMTDAQGPIACGYRSRFVAGDPGSAITVGDVSMMVTWSSRHKSAIGLLKLRVERHVRSGDGYDEAGVATLARAQIATPDLAASVVPAVPLQESPDDAGYYTAPADGGAIVAVMYPDKFGLDGDQTTMSRDLMFSFKDAGRAAEETIRYRAVLKGADAQGFNGCMLKVSERGQAELRGAGAD
jgi:hypothetical protein